MTEQREYLVALDVRSTLHAWIAAEGEDDAIRKAEDLYGEDDTSFTAKAGAIESAMVLESRSARSPCDLASSNRRRTTPGATDIAPEVLHDVAHVTFAMHEALSECREDLLPSGYRYHVFGGFPGFCSHAAEAGYALSQAFADLATDAWPEITGDFAGRVIAGAVASGYPLARSELAGIAAALCVEALRDGAAWTDGRRP